jgi:hypothetical protein
MKRVAIAVLVILGAIASIEADAYCINANDVGFVPSPATANEPVSVYLEMYFGVWHQNSVTATVNGNVINVFAENSSGAALPPPANVILIPIGTLAAGTYSVVLTTREWGNSGGTNIVSCPTVTVPLVVAGGVPEAVAAPMLSPLWLAFLAALLTLTGLVGQRRT